MAFYLKYRPQTLEEVVGQEAVTRALSAAFASSKLSHAYLFVGPRGTGKTSTARILAKMVNCESPAALDVPCNKCSSCLSITSGSNLDLIEIDAASNRGIDDIRTLKETISLSPTQSKKKVYIIDEVHMLTTEAFNALLKTLEEPPSHVLFILATTEGHKIPETILSRVVKLDFKLASFQELLQQLERVAKKEKLEISKEALGILVKRAEGSFRDGVKMLEAAASLDKKIEVEDVEELLKASSFESQYKLLEQLSQKETKKVLLILEKIVEGGVNIKEFCLSLMGFLRALVFIKNDLGKELVEKEMGEEKYQSLLKLSEKFSLEDLIKGLELFQAAWEKIKVSSIPSLPLELVIVQMGQAQIRSDKKVDDRSLKIELEDGRLKIDKQEPSSTLHHPTSNDDIAKLQEKWNFILETIRPYNYSLEALLRSVKVLDCADGILLLEVPYSFHQRILETPRNKETLESVISEVLAKPIRVSCVLDQKPTKIEDIANVELAQEDDVLRLASEIFSGEVVD